MRVWGWYSVLVLFDLHRAAVLGSALDKAFYRHAGIPHWRPDFGEHADAVLDDQPDIMVSVARAGAGGWRLVEQFDRHRKGRTIFVARYVDNVRNDCRSRRPRPRAGALEEQPADEIALGDDRVEGAGDIGERMVGGDQAGLDLLIQSPRIALRHAEQADAVRSE